jgi:sugar/nucleoside kinase (ribokinase family)
MNSSYDFIAIGDIVTDAFIRLKDPAAHIDIDRGRREICFGFGDKVPYDQVEVVPGVGNSANAAVAVSRLGLKSALVASVGDDFWGEECLAVMRAEGVGTEYIKVHQGVKTNYHYVLWYEDDRTILIKHEEYAYELPEIGEPRWVYLSSLGGNSARWHEVLEMYFKQHPQINLAFQPGTYQISLGKERLAGIYQRTKVFLVNKEEAQRILGTDDNDPKHLLVGIQDLGPEIVVITDGIKGAYALADGEAWYMPPYPDPKPPLERTGAGDAFSSTFVAALCLGMSVLEALQWAPINSMSVVQYVGAREGLLRRDQLEDYLKRAPADYKPKRI